MQPLSALAAAIPETFLRLRDRPAGVFGLLAFIVTTHAAAVATGAWTQPQMVQLLLGPLLSFGAFALVLSTPRPGVVEWPLLDLGTREGSAFAHAGTLVILWTAPLLIGLSTAVAVLNHRHLALAAAGGPPTDETQLQLVFLVLVLLVALVYVNARLLPALMDAIAGRPWSLGAAWRSTRRRGMVLSFVSLFALGIGMILSLPIRPDVFGLRPVLPGSAIIIGLANGMGDIFVGSYVAVVLRRLFEVRA